MSVVSVNHTHNPIPNALGRRIEADVEHEDRRRQDNLHPPRIITEANSHRSLVPDRSLDQGSPLSSGRESSASRKKTAAKRSGKSTKVAPRKMSANRLSAAEEGIADKLVLTTEEKKARGPSNARRNRAVAAVVAIVCGLGLLSAAQWKTSIAATNDVPETRHQSQSEAQQTTASGYITIIDAGSSGCRAHVFSYWVRGGVVHIEPRHNNMKVRPGLSTFADHPDDAGSSLLPLVDFIKSEVPVEERRSTPVLVKATAGLRMVPPEASEAILRSVQQTLSAEFAEVDARIISGIEEAGFGWLSVNTLADSFETSEFIGTIELGGASAQVTQRATDVSLPQSNSFKFNLGRKDFELYAVSYLGYGQEKARGTLTDYLSVQGLTTDPCLPSGYPQTGGVYDPVPGAASAADCRSAVTASLFPASEPCAFEIGCSGMQGAAQPSGILDQSDRLLLFENFYYTAAMLGLPMPEAAVQDYAAAATRVCDMDWAALEVSEYPKDGSEKDELAKLCFSATYIAVFLSKGLGLSDDKPILIQHDIQGHDIDWSLGAAIVDATDYIARANSP